MTLKGACLYAQSGGPTAVINASAYGVFKTALDAHEITNVYAAANGIVGVLNDKIYNIGKEAPNELAMLPGTPAAAFGSCRHKLKPPEVDNSEYLRILEVFKKYDIRYFFYNGGNDSMDTCDKISRFFAKNDYECRIIGIPKSIDNDLCGTDRAPGFGSAAKYIAASVAEICLENRVYDAESVIIIETMGRHAGWLTGASALAGLSNAAPDLIYLPEIAFDMERFVGDIRAVVEKNKRCLVVVSEGLKYADGKFVSETPALASDEFQHAQLGGVASTLSRVVKERVCKKTRGIELSLLQRCAAHNASKTDMDEAFEVGKFAVEQAIAGENGKMASILPIDNKNSGAKYALNELSVTANNEKVVPREWINSVGNYVTQEFIDYALPLIQGEFAQTENGVPRFAKLKLALC